MLKISELTAIKNSLSLQYRNSGNISARINLHKKYSVNEKGWFPWLFEKILDESEQICASKNTGEKITILEIGCGNGELWSENIKRIPLNAKVILSDISSGMVSDAKKNIYVKATKKQIKDMLDDNFVFADFDANEIPYEDNSFDMVIADHMLFYFDKPDKVVEEIRRVLKKDGVLFTSTYGSAHMKEITDLVKEFDERISLAAKNLYLVFGLDNGEKILKKQFSDIKKYIYDDCLMVDEANPMIEYILSCHGNQNRYIPDRYKEFKEFVQKKVKNGFRITKEAGCFICVKK